MSQTPEFDSDPALRRTYRGLQSDGSGRCPDDETLAGLVLGELSASERETLADHVVGCRACSENFQILAAAHAEAGRNQLQRSRRLGFFGVAAVLLSVGLALFLLPRSGENVVRGAGSETPAVSPAQDASLVAAPAEFRWPEQKEADGYRVRLFDASGDQIWLSERVRGARAELPSAIRARLKSRQGYFWTVGVEGQLGERRLGPYPFSIR